MKILEAQYGVLTGKTVTINEAQYVLQNIQGFTATLSDPNDPRITFKLNLAN